MPNPLTSKKLLAFSAGLALGAVLAAANGHQPAVGRWRVNAHGTVRGKEAATLDRYLERLEAYGFSGSVLIARHGRVLLDRGYGLANADTGELYTGATQFDVASVSKQFTAAAIVALEMDGRLRVEDPLSYFFPEAPPDKAAITLHQLLTHTSGLVDVLGPEYERLPRAEMLRRAFAANLLGPPGKRFRYSNTGYSVLAAIVEVVSGRPLGTYLRQRLFLPSGMQHTGLRLPVCDRQRLAHGYSLDGPWGTPLDHPWQADGPYWNLRGNGGVLSTVEDLYAWHLVLAVDGVLSAPARRKLITPYIHEGRKTPSVYAYGWSTGPAPDGTRMVSHTGGNYVFETDFRRYLDDQLVLVASSNRADYSAVEVAAHLENRLFGLRDPEPPAPVKVAVQETERCAGTFALADGEIVDATAAKGGLELAARGPGGLGLLVMDQSAEEQALMAERSGKVLAALEGSRTGDDTDLGELFGQAPEQEARPLRAAVNAFSQRLGAWTGSAVLGSVSQKGYPFTYALLQFERGSRLAEYRWQGPTVEVVRYPPRPSGRLYLPEARGSTAPGNGAAALLHFGAYDVRTGSVQHLRCNLPPKGSALSLVIETPKGDTALLATGQ